MKTELYIQLRWNLPLWFMQLITNWFPDNKYTLRFRGLLVKPFIKNVGRNFQLGSGVTLLNSYNLEIGDNVYIAKGSWVNSMGGLRIEDEVVIAPYVVISTMQHLFKDNSVRFAGSTPGSVKIGKGSWLAAHSSIKCGIEIGKGNLIAANSFVSNNTEDNMVYGGVPAKKIKPIRNTDGGVKSRKDLLKDNRNLQKALGDLT